MHPKAKIAHHPSLSASRYEQVDTSEYASMFKWYQAFEEATFAGAGGAALRRWTLNLYPGIIKAAMAVFDVVESIAVSRTRICAAGGLHALTRVQVRPQQRQGAETTHHHQFFVPFQGC